MALGRAVRSRVTSVRSTPPAPAKRPALALAAEFDCDPRPERKKLCHRASSLAVQGVFDNFNKGDAFTTAEAPQVQPSNADEDAVLKALPVEQISQARNQLKDGKEEVHAQLVALQRWNEVLNKDLDTVRQERCAEKDALERARSEAESAKRVANDLLAQNAELRRSAEFMTQAAQQCQGRLREVLSSSSDCQPLACAEAQLRNALLQPCTTPGTLWQAMREVEALLGEARREVETKQIYQRRSDADLPVGTGEHEATDHAYLVDLGIKVPSAPEASTPKQLCTTSANSIGPTCSHASLPQEEMVRNSQLALGEPLWFDLAADDSGSCESHSACTSPASWSTFWKQHDQGIEDIPEHSEQMPGSPSNRSVSSVSSSPSFSSGVGQQDLAIIENDADVKRQIFRAVETDNIDVLADVMWMVPLGVWVGWQDENGQDLLMLSKSKGASKVHAVLTRDLRLLMNIQDDALAEHDGVLVYMPGEAQPRTATVLEETPAGATEVFVEFWGGDISQVHVARCLVRRAAC